MIKKHVRTFNVVGLVTQVLGTSLTTNINFAKTTNTNFATTTNINFVTTTISNFASKLILVVVAKLILVVVAKLCVVVVAKLGIVFVARFGAELGPSYVFEELPVLGISGLIEKKRKQSIPKYLDPMQGQTISEFKYCG